ncbi:MAG: hypothetical protein HY727_04410 [Candidatus Rokubacteria bacterium]|nr:hypothetical protein [Candidatus Rokubacteria bacterium]
MTTQVVDTESAREFMRETLQKITEAELLAIAGELGGKYERFSALLQRPVRDRLGADELRRLLRSVFSTRRKAGEVLDRVGAPRLAGWIDDLLEPRTALDARFQTFYDRLAGLPESVRFDLASELLHFTDPERYWLWTRWVWDPHTRTGALPLVTMEEYDLDAETVGKTYLRVGQAIAFVHETGRAAGFTRIGQGPFGVDVYLACVYCVYVYTTVRMRMTQEFNRVIPPLPELARRFLGVYRMEI